MHVSEKISYHLSDAFFKHLLESDYVANESEPSSWSELYDLLPNENYNYYTKFYQQFYLKPLDKRGLIELFRAQNYTMDNLLFRTNEHGKDFQEETYLDMFIYQTGKKYNKKTIGLEDAKESMMLVMNIDYDDAMPKEENIQKITRILRNKTFEEALSDFYRDKDLDMIDSLLTLSSPEPFLEGMLYKRNYNMVRSIDSIVKKGSLFAAIGAAHLPGKKGVIEMLRSKGYTVTPVFDNYTEKGKTIKKQIDKYFTNPFMETKVSNDGFLSLPMYSMIIPSKEDYNSPDLANGGYINVKRSLLLNFLKKKKQHISHTSLDSLFYENIPGNIIEKKFFEDKNFVAYDIKNRTKTGNDQRYRFYVTPLEIISINMIGNGDYVNQYENEVFSKIKLRNATNQWQNIVPKKGAFEVSIPDYHIIYGNQNNQAKHEDIEIYAFDKEENAYYFIIERHLNDKSVLEETAYELKRIQEEFYTQYDATEDFSEVAKSEKSYHSKSILYEQPIQLKTLLNGSSYYLLGAVNASPKKATQFLNSFEFKPLTISEEFEVLNDSTGHFQVEIPKKQNEILFLKNHKKATNKKGKKTNHFKSQSNSVAIKSASGKTINLDYYKFHKYEFEKNADSTLFQFKKIFQKNNDLGFGENEIVMEDFYEDEEWGFYDSNDVAYFNSKWETELGLGYNSKKKASQLTIISENTDKNTESGQITYDALISKATSQQAIKLKAIFKDGITYQLKTIVPKNYQNDDPFIEKVYQSFSPTDTVFQHSLYEPKLKDFIEDAKSPHDSIRYSALKSIAFLKIQKEEINTLQEFINQFEFNTDEVETLAALYEKIGHLKDPAVITFLEKNYKRDEISTQLQLSILKGLAHQKSKKAYEKILELLVHDLPLSTNKFEIINLMGLFQKDLENSQVLFPDIFQFYSIPEYHEPVISFCAALLNKNMIQPKKLKSYKKMILTNAKLEYKRVAGWKSKKTSDDEMYDDSESVSGDLKKYIQLIYPFKKEKDFEALISKIVALNIEPIQLEILNIELKNKTTIDKQFVENLLSNKQTLFASYQMLYDAKEFQILESITDEQLIEAAIIHLDKVNAKKEELVFLEKKTLEFENKEIGYWFYKMIPSKEDDNNYYNMQTEKLLCIAFVLDKNNKCNPKAYFSPIQKQLVDDELIPSLMIEMIDESIHKKRVRASFGKIESDFENRNMLGFY
ncbi:hypothetical protein GCM10011343_06800 [Flavobacterium orientale]|uniref:TraB/GumN family protein n=2 Tax=Flavobacterium orientale TaxID=1756020 RepID=A0A917DAV8_9FLAO|nr:hypothetical protein GCM10011343_06800 [Flavobacterium orientale]